MVKLIELAGKRSLCLVFALGATPAQALDLSEAYQLALDHSPIIKQAEAKRSAIKESKDQSIARFLPTLALTGATSRDWLHNKKAGADFRGPEVNQAYWSHTFNVNLRQPLFHWDYWVQLKQSENQVAQIEAAYQAELQNVMIKTCESYFNALVAQDNLDFFTAEKEAISRQLAQVKERYEVGLIAITDVHEAQAGYDQAVANEIEAANLLESQKDALRVLIGENEASLSALGEQLPLVSPEPKELSAWSDSAEANNLDIIAALNQTEALRKNIELQKNGHLPSLDLVASYGASDVNSSFGLRGDTQSVGLQFNMNLFEGGAVNSRTRQAGFEYQAAKENLNQKKLELKRQVKEAFRGVATNMSRVEALKSSVNSAQSAVETTQAGFDMGIRSMSDVLNEQRNLYRAKRDYSRSRYDYLINSLKLKFNTSNLTVNDLQQVDRLLNVKAMRKAVAGGG